MLYKLAQARFIVFYVSKHDVISEEKCPTNYYKWI